MYYSILFFIGLLLFSPLHAKKAEKSSHNPKLLVLIIASDNDPIYIEHQKIWRSYMHLDKEHVEAYFIKCDPLLESDVLIDRDVIWVKGEECIKPGIINKTLLAIEAFLPRLQTEFDFVLRSNLSSFFVFPRLLDFLSRCPKQGFYGSGGVTNHYNYGCRGWAHGCGIFFSSDIAECLVKNKSTLYNRVDENDDVVIGQFLIQQQGYSLSDTDRLDLLNLYDWAIHAHNIPSHFFHFRVKNCNQPERRLIDDLFIYKQLMTMFYPNAQIK